MKQHSMVWLIRSLVSAAAIVCLLSTGWTQPAGTDAGSAFSEAYAAYTSAIEVGDDAAALTAAKSAYEHGLAHFGRVNDNTAALAMNYANRLAISGADNAAAAEMFGEAGEIYAALHGPESLQRVEVLLALASVQASLEERLASVDAALSLHRTVVPDDDIAYARLQSNAGELLAGVAGGGTEAGRILTEALDTLEQAFGRDSPELFSTLLALGGAAADGGPPSRRQLAFLDRAIEIAKTADSDEAVADIQLQIAYQLARQPGGYADARPYASAAHDIYLQRLGVDHPKTALAALTLGQAFFATRDREQGISTLEQAIRFYDGKPEYIPNLIRARQLLMSAYMGPGDVERYTEQLMEVGRLSESLPSPVEYLPLVKVAPIYPPSAAQRRAEGWVVVQYTVDEEGRTRDPTVVDSGATRGDSEIFHDSAVESVRGYRYIPRFENGMPVSVPGVRTRITFEIL